MTLNGQDELEVKQIVAVEFLSMAVGKGLWESSSRTASDRKAWRNTDAGSIPRCGKGFYFSQNQLLSVDSLCVVLRSPPSPPPLSLSPPHTSIARPPHPQHAMACIDVSEHVKKQTANPGHGSHTIVWTRENTVHTGREWAALLLWLG